MAILIFGVGTLGFDSLGTPHAAVREGQVERNLNWLDGNERQLDEEAPMGLTHCAETSREQARLLQITMTPLPRRSTGPD